ncbi:MAG: hypothetical protein U9Q63_01390 [Patescibacteria group bacterium]|nr:hypothetical protein [Patescibacteria group bacterium]
MTKELVNPFVDISLPTSSPHPSIKTSLDYSQGGPPVGLIEEQILANQRVEEYYRGASELTVGLTHNRPIQVLFLGDLHWGSLSVKTEYAKGITDKILEQPDTYVLFLGDQIESIHSGRVRTSLAASIPHVQSHLRLFRENTLLPLAKEGRVLGLIAGHFGHEFWLERMNLWLEEVKGTKCPILNPGAKVRVVFKNGHRKTIMPYHMTPRRGVIDRLHGLTTVAKSLSATDRQTFTAVAAHQHRAAIGVEVGPDGDEVSLLQIGTCKAIEADLSDPFITAIGGGKASPLGQGVIYQARRRANPVNRQTIYPSFSAGKTVHESLRLLDATEKQGITKEVIEESRSHLGRPKIVYQARSSRLVKSRFPEANKINGGEVVKGGSGYASQFEVLSIKVETKLPITLMPITGSRIGSYTENYEFLKELVDVLEKEPNFFTVLGRSIVDQEVAKNPNRLSILDEAVKQLTPAQESAFALMLDGSLRHGGWKSKLKEGSPIAAATYLSRKLGDLRIIDNKSYLNLRVGFGEHKTAVNIMLLDHLLGYGSYSKATSGLRSIYNHNLFDGRDKPGVMIGGHMALAGTASLHDYKNKETPWPHFIAPGWVAHKVDSGGKANVQKGGKAGLGLIILPGEKPGDYFTIPTKNLDETQYLSQALTLLVAQKAFKLDL